MSQAVPQPPSMGWAATNGVSTSVCVSVRACACVSYSSTNQEHNLKKRGEISTFLNLSCATVCSCCVYFYHTVIVLRCASHGATAAVLQCVVFVTATNGASVLRKYGGVLSSIR